MSKTNPTLIPSSISVGETRSARATTNFATCLRLIMYFASGFPASMILVQCAT